MSEERKLRRKAKVNYQSFHNSGMKGDDKFDAKKELTPIKTRSIVSDHDSDDTEKEEFEAAVENPSKKSGKKPPSQAVPSDDEISDDEETAQLKAELESVR